MAHLNDFSLDNENYNYELKINLIIVVTFSDTIYYN